MSVLGGGHVPRNSGGFEVRKSRRRVRGLVFGSTVLATCGAVAGVAATAAATAVARPVHVRSVAPAPGTWIPLGAGFNEPSNTPAVWGAPDHRGWILWPRRVNNSQWTYEAAIIAANGAISVAPTPALLPSKWGSLTDYPALVAHGNAPQLVFDGLGSGDSLGCLRGALPANPTWSLQPWSLSNNCNNINAAATEGKGGVLSAVWPGGPGVLYRIGTSSATPATGPDSHITLSKTTTGKAGDASDLAGNGDFYVGWTQIYSTPAVRDGIYVEDVTKSGSVLKAPSSGTNSIGEINLFGEMAMTSSNSHPGVFLAYCNNFKSTCTVELWHVGQAKALNVPGSSAVMANAFSVALSAGPDGRLWIAWSSRNNYDVYTVRTNKADTRFGAVHAWKTPCTGAGLIGLSGGSWGRLDVANQCPNAKSVLEEFVTQSLAGLDLRLSSRTVHNTSSTKVNFTVTDAGDPVAGATVIVNGKRLTTDPAGTASLTFAKGTRAGSYKVTATAPNYFGAASSVSVVK